MPKGIDDLIGSIVLERYKVLRRLGSGGMGAVYEVEHTAMATHHAMKIMLAGEDSPRRATLQDRFLREARLCARIRHPNLVMVTDFGFHNGHPTLVMDYVAGQDYSQIIRSEGPLNEGQALVTLSAVASALAVIHQQGIIHRDLKPANIMREDGTGRVVVMDLGIAKDMNDAGATMDIIGTPAYMPPEQAKNSSRVSAASDVYSLGATLVALLSGKAPIRGTSALQVMIKVQEQVFAHGSIFGLVQDLENKLSPKTAALIRDMTRYDPESRIQNGMDVVARLRDVMNGGVSISAKDNEQVSMTLATAPHEDDGLPTLADAPMDHADAFDQDQPYADDDAYDDGSGSQAELPSRLLEQSLASLAPSMPRKRSKAPLVLLTGVLFVLVLGLAWFVVENLRLSNDIDPVVSEERQGEEPIPASIDPTRSSPAPADIDPEPVPAMVWPQYFSVDLINQRMCLLPPGRVRLGSEDPSQLNERPQVEVSFTRPLYIAETTVTRGQYARFLSASGNPHYDPGQGQFSWQGESVRALGDMRLPVVAVTLQEARAFAAWLASETGLMVRLPAEAEWEYAARGPAGYLWPWGDRWRPDVVHADGRDGPAPVGSYASGASWIGALDMAGNVFEWCDEWFDEDRWTHIARTDPKPERSDDMGVFHVVRGGAFTNPRHLCRGSFRIGIRGSDRQTVVGFRIVIETDPALEQYLSAASE